MRHNFLLTLLLCSPLLVTGCGDTNDPAISNPVITTTAIAPTTLSISWARATDSNTSASALVYKVYVSGANPAYQSFDTLGEVEAGTLVQTLTDAASAAITTGITANSARYINIVVEDEDGNKALYEPLGEYFHANQLSYYPFNGNTNDVTATLNHLVVAVDPALPTLALPTATSDRFLHAGSAYSFNPATPQCLQSSVPVNVSITGSNARTVSFWVQSANTPTSTQRAAFAWGNESGNGTSFGFRESGLAANWTVWLGTGSVSTVTPATANWEHWVVGSSGGSLSGYKNGAAVTIPAATVNTATTLLYVGCGIINAATGLGNPYQGNIDDVRIFNALLNGTDVANLYGATRP